jgi:hypothetical protein
MPTTRALAATWTALTPSHQAAVAAASVAAAADARHRCTWMTPQPRQGAWTKVERQVSTEGSAKEMGRVAGRFFHPRDMEMMIVA